VTPTEWMSDRAVRHGVRCEPVMRNRRKIIVYIATSADGYIARPDGDVEWLNRRPRNVDYGMRAFYRTIDTILWGRNTYDWALNYYKKRGQTQGLFDTKLANYVFSRKPPRRAAPGVEFVSEPVEVFARRLRALSGKHIWMMGGGGLIASFLDKGEIDEFDIHVIPVFIGEGIPLVAPRHRDLPLRLRSSRKYPDGVVRLRYEVPRLRRAAANRTEG
jgi:dihydrofolate reductase